MSAGSRQLTVTASNLAGTSAPTAAQTLTVGRGGGGDDDDDDVVIPPTPAAPIVGGTPTRPVLSGNTTPGATVEIRDGGSVVGTVTAAADGSWSWTPASDLSPGEHQFTVVASNAAGSSVPSSPMTVTVPTSGGGGSGTGSSGGTSGSSSCGVGDLSSLILLMGLLVVASWRSRPPSA